MWRSCLIDVLDEQEPGHAVTTEALRPSLNDGFPWHRADTPHPELCDPEAWWNHVEPLFASAYESVGFAPVRSRELAHHVRRHYTNADGWELFPDAIPALTTLHQAGWNHIILSNHVPELQEIVHGLGLTRLIAAVLSSASSGHEKPHPQAFAIGRARAGNPDVVWMIGDSFTADYQGAQDVGIPAILVRTRDERARPCFDTLDEVVSFLSAAEPGA